MGETPQRHLHTVNSGQFDRLLDKLGEGFALIAGAMAYPTDDTAPGTPPTLVDQPLTPAPAAPPVTLADLAEPWQFYGPSHGTIVAGYVDESNQTRFVALDQEPHVPTSWRKIWISR
jgi:hypothetical protein